MLSKHFNHLHPYIEIATAISDVIGAVQRYFESRRRHWRETTATDDQTVERVTNQTVRRGVRSHQQRVCYTSNKNFILKYFRCRDGKRTETRIGMEGICITHSCIPLYTVYMQHIMAHSGGMQEWVIQIPSIPILVSVLFPSLHLKYFRIKFLLLVCIVFMRMRTKPHPHPVIS